MAEPSHPAYPLPANIGREHRTEAIPPQPHGFVTQIVTTLEKEVFDVPKAKRISHIQHHHHADDFGR